MATNRQILQKLDELRGKEQRMALIYRRAAQLVTGPSRFALVEELQEHADEETEHADNLMTQIMAMGGDIGEDIPSIPVWRTLDEVLQGLQQLEEEGIRGYQELRRMLAEDDPFRFYVESTLEAELHHLNDVKQWLRTDYAEKSIMDLGSPRPLNWQEPFVAQPMEKSVSWEDRLQAHHRFGTPPTMHRGAFNGAMPTLSPGLQTLDQPPLIMEKAVRTPQDPGSSRAQFQRKRDSHGKFAPQQTAGTESTAAQDVAEEKRRAELRAAKQKEQLRGDWREADPGHEAERKMHGSGLKKGAPGANGAAEEPSSVGAAGNQPPSNPIGETPSGKLIYDDPYHPEHDQFSPQDHEYAAQMHQQEADAANVSGEAESAMQHQQKASVHEERAQSNQSPMERAVTAPVGPNSAPPQHGMQLPPPMNMGKALNYSYSPDNLDEFTAPRDQQKPNLGGMGQGPAPGMLHTATNGPVGPQTEPGAPLPNDNPLPPPPPGMMGAPMGATPPIPEGDPMAPVPGMPPADPMAPVPGMPPADPMAGAGAPGMPPADPMAGAGAPGMPTTTQQTGPSMSAGTPPMVAAPPSMPPDAMVGGAAGGGMDMADEGQSYDSIIGTTEGSMQPSQPQPPPTDLQPKAPSPSDGAPFSGNPTETKAEEEGGGASFGNEAKEESGSSPFGNEAKEEAAEPPGQDNPQEEKKPPFMKSLKDWRRRH